jgi:hypothetical protein
MNSNIKNKKIELFVDNGIDGYRRTDEATLLDLGEVYVKNRGFFVLADSNYKTIGYLDLRDLESVSRLIEGFRTDINLAKKKIKEKGGNYLTFRTDFISHDEKLIDVVKRLNQQNQNYIPVVKNNILIGRVSREILRKKFKDLF